MTLNLEPRLLHKKMAAKYAGVCSATFAETCPIKPVLIAGRIKRYDRRRLDEWIDSFDGSPPASGGDNALVEAWINGNKRSNQGA